MVFKRATTSSQLFMPISIGLVTGPAACASRVAALPSQNCTALKAEFHTVGALRPPVWPLTPIELGRLSSPPNMVLWQDAQETVPVEDKRGSW